MTVEERLRNKAARRLYMGDIDEAPRPTLPREATHATKIYVKFRQHKQKQTALLLHIFQQ